ncbi:alanyl-tRNA synthetase [Thecamonas trahens ATCC 50062]|uniref:Alanine--tRNA ligase n=1 Tax=Thecamonas trahens ATCC 50062 TaxID=461836 RepID=A0A0L0D0Y8_THETB|nr:alanyl-tRNA synthetase [Thecamonas trahens ATCC 50062]KNC45891.1 alanyl-tRNA synthetase [Thecamonas trahens ATCC 50062]|eukprot:XP_013762880.1 alanyl-tRNA synthetase [Thecamonas trahens ATCC 50062]
MSDTKITLPSTSGKDVRETFIKFFTSKYGHTFVPSSSVVPLNDPTLLFTNAGMNQFKPIFVGRADPLSAMAQLKSAANSQKCIRAGGKHNDLEDVGKDVYHHTFFEMLGNWSFGDYFKSEAIDMAWELLTSVFGIEADRLYATYFGGDEEAGLEPDLEARDIWLRYLPEDHVLPGNMKDNFWEMGETGPCGPCSELHYDRIGGRNAAHLVNMDVPEVLEIWNLVFMQYERTTDGLVTLPNQHVDTGAGLERIVSVLQNKMSNYDTDLFTPIFDAIREVTGAREYTGLVGDEDVDKIDMAYRVVADHVRMLTFSIADGGLPSNNGRGYVVRRVLRRAIRYVSEKLGGSLGSLHELVDVVIANFGEAFPEIAAKRDLVVEVITAEEVKFGRTLDRGVQLFKKFAEASTDGKLAGKVVFQLYDTYGFPTDLTELMAEERGLTIDWERYEAERLAAVERSRSAKSATGIVLETQAVDGFTSRGSTDDSAKFDDDCDEHATEVVGVYNYDERTFVEAVAAGTAAGTVFGIMTTTTNFYAEGGGQIYDSGTLAVGATADDAVPVLSIFNCQAYAGAVVHFGRLVEGAPADALTAGAEVWLLRDAARRSPIRANHTATHLLNHALRAVLGDHVGQRGSLVDEDKLRFDFSHNSRIEVAQVTAIEDHVRKIIVGKLPVYAKVVPLEDATNINGLQQVFGETYPSEVRVVSVGVAVDELLANPDSDQWPAYAIELCGGTHLSNSGEAEAFAVLSEESVGGGTRRMVAVTGDAAREAIGLAAHWRNEVTALTALPDEQLVGALPPVKTSVTTAKLAVGDKAALLATIDELVSRVVAFRKAKAQVLVDAAIESAAALAADSPDLAEGGVVVQVLDLGDVKKGLAKVMKAYASALPKASVVIINAGATGKVEYMATTPKGAAVTAKAVVAAINDAAGGRGGGKPTSAQGSAPSPADAPVDIDAVVAAANAALSA